MNTPDLMKLRYPVGNYARPQQFNDADLATWRNEIEAFPHKLAQMLQGVTRQQLEWCYRPEGWCVAQVVHHCADSHMNAYIRCKLSLTEQLPTIKPYYEDRWAQLPDAMATGIDASMKLLEGLHERWSALLAAVEANDWKAKGFTHPEHGRVFPLWEVVALYAWHCRHHAAHIEQALASQGAYGKVALQ